MRLSGTSFWRWHNSPRNAWGKPEFTSQCKDGCQGNRVVTFISVENICGTCSTFSKLNVLLRSNLPRFLILNCYHSLLSSSPYYTGQRASAQTPYVISHSLFSSIRKTVWGYSVPSHKWCISFCTDTGFYNEACFVQWNASESDDIMFMKSSRWVQLS